MLFPLPRSLQRSNNTGAAVAEDGDSGGSAVAEGAQGARASCCPIPEAVGNGALEQHREGIFALAVCLPR